MVEVMLCRKCEVEAVPRTGWVAEQKFDGVRAYVEGGVLYDRKNKPIGHKFPEFVLSQLPQGVVLDGEIVALSGEFNDISGRVHLKDALRLRIASKRNPAVFMVFDAVTNDVLKVRRNLLKSLVLPSWARLAEQYPATEFDSLWASVLEKQQEGLVVKREDSYYQQGSRSADWLKVKAFKEVVAVFVKYVTHPKGILMETADGRSCNVNGAQAQGVIAKFAADGKVTAEVQYLPQKDSDAWRFPSFRGLV